MKMIFEKLASKTQIISSNYSFLLFLSFFHSKALEVPFCECVNERRSIERERLHIPVGDLPGSTDRSPSLTFDCKMSSFCLSTSCQGKVFGPIAMPRQRKNVEKR